MRGISAIWVASNDCKVIANKIQLFAAEDFVGARLRFDVDFHFQTETREGKTETESEQRSAEHARLDSWRESEPLMF